MKNLFTLTFLLSFNLVSFAQEQKRFVYCEMVASNASLFANHVTIEIDFGQKTRFSEDGRAKDPETGEPLRFNSKMDAVNFLVNQGWDLVQVFAVHSCEISPEYHYVFKREDEGNKEEEINDY